MEIRDKDTKKNTENQYIPDDAILKIAKEIVVKFIEVGRITPTTFDTSFRQIYATIETTVRNK
jgi:hypothetical protein